MEVDASAVLAFDEIRLEVGLNRNLGTLGSGLTTRGRRGAPLDLHCAMDDSCGSFGCGFLNER